MKRSLRSIMCTAALLACVLHVQIQAQVHIDNAGNLGVGTDDPIEELSINGDMQIIQSDVQYGRGGLLNAVGREVRALEFYYAPLNLPFAKISAINYKGGGTGWYQLLDRVDAGLSFFVSNDGTMSEALRLSNLGDLTLYKGNLAIGDNYISHDGSDDGLRISSSGNLAVGDNYISNDGSDDGLQISSSGNLAIGDNYLSHDGSDDGLRITSTGNIAVGNNYISNDGDDEGIRINTEGRVAIGASPSASVLRVVSKATGSETVAASFNSPSNSLYNTVYIQGTSQADVSVLSVRNGTGDYLIAAQGSGNVGIMTSNPGYALQVGSNGDGTQARANAWNTFSDRRWKTELEVVSDPIEKIEAITGYYYKWIDRPDSTTQLGLMAQEVEAVLPQVVSTDDEGYKSVDYSKLTALLIEGIKEQNRVLELLKQENADIASKMEDQDREILQRLAEVEAKLDGKMR